MTDETRLEKLKGLASRYERLADQELAAFRKGCDLAFSKPEKASDRLYWAAAKNDRDVMGVCREASKSSSWFFFGCGLKDRDALKGVMYAFQRFADLTLDHDRIAAEIAKIEAGEEPEEWEPERERER